MEPSRFTNRRRRLLKLAMFGLPVAGLIALAAVRGPYFFPVQLALGPCLPDWTSPTTYIALFEEPASPMGQVTFGVGPVRARVCYGRPSARNRTIFGDHRALVPDGRLWRMGANEPTRLFVKGSVRVGTLRLDPGRYAIYALPGPSTWEIFVTSSTFHWGNRITEAVRARELGSFHVDVERTMSFTEQLTMRAERQDADETTLILEWADRQVRIPVQAASPAH